MPSLPGQTSDLIIEGSTTECAARMSLDRTATYTECRVVVGKTIKDATGKEVPQNSEIYITREGGEVTLNGKTVSSGLAGQRLPQLAGRHLLFLKYRPQTDDYSILTSYTLTPKGLRAVDDPPHFHLHDGKSEAVLMPEVEASILDESNYLPRRKSRGAK